MKTATSRDRMVNVWHTRLSDTFTPTLSSSPIRPYSYRKSARVDKKKKKKNFLLLRCSEGQRGKLRYRAVVVQRWSFKITCPSEYIVILHELVIRYCSREFHTRWSNFFDSVLWKGAPHWWAPAPLFSPAVRINRIKQSLCMSFFQIKDVVC